MRGRVDRRFAGRECRADRDGDPEEEPADPIVGGPTQAQRAHDAHPHERDEVRGCRRASEYPVQRHEDQTDGRERRPRPRARPRASETAARSRPVVAAITRRSPGSGRPRPAPRGPSRRAGRSARRRPSGAAETVEAAATTSPPPASDWRRCATLTASPITVYSSRPPPPIAPAITTPVFNPIPTCSASTASVPHPCAFSSALAMLHRERAPQRPLRVILGGLRRTEDRHHGVALELVDRAAVLRDHLGHRAEVTADDLARSPAPSVAPRSSRTRGCR